MIAPAFPSNTARGGVLYPIILSLAQNSGSKPDDEKNRRMGGYLMFCGMASLSVVVSPLAHGHLRQSNRRHTRGTICVKINFGSWIVAASIPVLTMIALLSSPPLQIVPTRRDQNNRCAEGRTRRSEHHGTSHTRRVDRCGGFCVHGDWMGDGGDPELESSCRGLRWPGCAACNQCPHT